MKRAGQAILLLRCDLMRATGSVRHPTAGGIIGVALPSVLVVTLLWTMGPSALPDLDGTEGAVSFGLLIAAVPALFSYGILFRGRDTSFLRRLASLEVRYSGNVRRGCSA